MVNADPAYLQDVMDLHVRSALDVCPRLMDACPLFQKKSAVGGRNQTLCRNPNEPHRR